MSYVTITKIKKTQKPNKMSEATQRQSPKLTVRRGSLLLILGVVVSGIAASPLVYADRISDQINDLSQQNSAKINDVAALTNQAASYQDAIYKLQAEISNLQAQIMANEVQRTVTISKIADAEAQITHNKQMLSDILKSMYVSDGMSSLEMLATSRNLNDFVDQEQYNNSVQSQIQTTMAKIKELQAQLATQKTNLERMIANQQDMKVKVAAQQAEQSRLLALTQAQQADINDQIATNGQKIKELQKQQALENARLSGGKIPAGVPGGGGYPGVWAFAPMDTKLDSWGMYNRECVSWTAFRVAASGRYMPYWGGVGNANQWDNNARAAGILVNGSPRAGDVAVNNSGMYGHVMYVEDVGGDGSIFVSDYNQQYDGLYRTYWISAETVSAKDLVFIHF